MELCCTIAIQEHVHVPAKERGAERERGGEGERCVGGGGTGWRHKIIEGAATTTPMNRWLQKTGLSHLCGLPFILANQVKFPQLQFPPHWRSPNTSANILPPLRHPCISASGVPSDYNTALGSSKTQGKQHNVPIWDPNKHLTRYCLTKFQGSSHCAYTLTFVRPGPYSSPGTLRPARSCAVGALGRLGPRS
jgi:hypothetical protein